MERFAQCLNIMAIDNNGMPAKSLHACTIDICVVSKSSWLALAQPVGEEMGINQYCDSLYATYPHSQTIDSGNETYTIG